jgi:DNA-binding response OmpR family regulator
MGQHALLIDDNPDDRVLIQVELRQAFSQLHCVPVVDATDFEAKLGAGGFDLVITDYQLRWTTGLDVLRTVKKRFPEVPVLMFTGTGSEEIAVEAMKAGLDDYVVKRHRAYAALPIRVRSLLERITTRRHIADLEVTLRQAIADLNVAHNLTQEQASQLNAIADAVVSRELRLAELETQNQRLKAEVERLKAALR